MNATPSAPTASLMNGWDYVLAITEQQINNGLRIAYEGGNVGTMLPRMPRGQHTLALEGEGEKRLVVNFGCPRIQAQYDELKQCDLVIPLPDSSVLDDKGSTKLPPDTCLVITTSLSSSGTTVGKSATSDTGAAALSIHHEAFVDFKAPEAAYKVRLEDPQHADLKPRIATSLKKKLQEFHEHAFRVASFDAPAEANPFVPRRVDTCFVRNAGQPGRSVLLFAASLEEGGARKEQRLEFDAGILPLDVPAALWVGPGVILEKLVLPMLKDALKVGANPPALRIDESKGEIRLFDRYELGSIGGKRSVLEGLRIYAVNGAMGVETHVRSYRVDGRYVNAVSNVRGHLTFNLSPDRTTFSSSTAIDHSDVQIENTMPKVLRAILGIFSLGLTEAIQAIINEVVKAQVNPLSSRALNEKLRLAAGKIGTVAQRIPALEDLTAGGHLIFERVAFIDGGAAFLGIHATAPAKQQSSAAPTLATARAASREESPKLEVAESGARRV